MDPTLESQLAYYRARAGEYDQWFFREGRYDRGAEDNAAWFDELRTVEEALQELGPLGDCLELAAGTGLWTQQLVPQTDSLCAVDGSAEMLDLCKQRLPDDKIEYLQADLFSWSPSRRFDTVFFAFWLSHVPAECFADFCKSLRSSLRPGGRIFFVDSRRDTTSTATDHVLPPISQRTLTRKLNDGREFEIYKIYHDPSELEGRFKESGLKVSIQQTSRYFLFGGGGVL